MHRSIHNRAAGATRVTVGLPVRNGEAFVEEALASLRGQRGVDFDIVIVDNASTDATQRICQRQARSDRRISYVRHAVNGGAAAGFNAAFRLARGEFFKWAAHDDVCQPDFLRACVEALEQRPDAVLAHPRSLVIDAASQPLELYDVRLQTAGHDPVHRFREVALSWHRCYEIFGLLRRAALPPRPMGSYAGADRVLLARLALQGPFLEIPEPLFRPRRHAGQSVQALRDNRARSLWFDPQGAGRSMPEWRQALGLAGAVLGSPLAWRQRAGCGVAVMRWCAAHAEGLARDVVHAVRHGAPASGAVGRRACA